MKGRVESSLKKMNKQINKKVDEYGVSINKKLDDLKNMFGKAAKKSESSGDKKKKDI